MGALAPLSTWTSEDDQLLKNAIQAGTPLESLGKGAVQFSRRFTFQELKDQWHFLTYHANVSVEPSPHNIECADSASTLSPKLHILEHEGEKSVHKKRMNDGAQDCYNPMLKKIKSSIVENEDNPQSTDYMYGEAKQKHFGSPVSNCESVRQHLPNLETASAASTGAAATPIDVTESCKFKEDCHSVAKEADQPSDMSMFRLNDPFWSGVETPFEFDETCLAYAENDVCNIGDSYTLSQIPVQNTYKSISEPTLPGHQVEEKERNAVNSADFHSAGYANNSEFLGCDVHLDAMDQITCHNMDNLAPNTDGLLAGSTGSCLDFGELEEFLFTDIDGNVTANIPDLDSFLSEFIWEENNANVEHSSIPGAGACSGDFVNYEQYMTCSSESSLLPSIPASNPEFPTCILDTHMLPSTPAANYPESHIACAPEAHLSVPAANPVLPISCVPEVKILPSKPNVDPDLPELCNGVICCVLNTEDTEIPCNDDVLITLSSRRRSGSSWKNYKLRGLKAMYTAECSKEKPGSSDESKEKPGSSDETINSQILFDLGFNLPFINPGA